MWPALVKVDELRFRSIGKRKEAPPSATNESKKQRDSSTSNGASSSEDNAPEYLILPENTKMGRAGPFIIRDGDEVPFAWFTYVTKKEEKEKDENKENPTDIIEIKVQNYIEERDSDGRPTLKHRRIHHFETQKELTLYDMSKPKTIKWLQRQLTKAECELLDTAFPIVGDGDVANEVVTRQSTLENDRLLFKMLQDKNLITDVISGWCHDDMQMGTEGQNFHMREAVIQKPNTIFKEAPPPNSSAPTTPVKQK